jgi:site-specific recombinase XerD
LRDAARKRKFPAYPASWYRHSVATWAIEKRADAGAVSTFLGHRHPSTVKRLYALHAVVPKVPTME